MSKNFRIGGVPEHFNLPWHLAMESGAFTDEGLQVEFVEVPGGTGAMTRMLRENELDAAIVLTEGAVADILNGSKNRLVKVYATSPLIWGIHVAADSDIESIEQIQGRSYAISRYGSGSHLMAIVDAAERGWETDDLEFVVIKNLEGARKELGEGNVDVFLWEKFMTKPYVDSGEFRRVGERVVPWPSFVVSTRDDMVESYATELKTILSIAQRFAEQLKNDPQAVTAISARYDLQEVDTREWFSQTHWCNHFDFPEQQISRVMDYLAKLEIVERNGQTPSDVWYDLS